MIGREIPKTLIEHSAFLKSMKFDLKKLTISLIQPKSLYSYNKVSKLFTVPILETAHLKIFEK